MVIIPEMHFTKFSSNNAKCSAVKISEFLIFRFIKPEEVFWVEIIPDDILKSSESFFDLKNK